MIYSVVLDKAVCLKIIPILSLFDIMKIHAAL
jgi:hypothetical protein